MATRARRPGRSPTRPARSWISPRRQQRGRRDRRPHRPAGRSDAPERRARRPRTASKGLRFTRMRIVVDTGSEGVVYKTADFHKPWDIGVTPDAAIQANIDELNAQLAPIFNAVVGTSTVVVPRADACAAAGTADGRACESLVGDIVTDAMRTTYGDRLRDHELGRAACRPDLPDGRPSAGDFCPPRLPSTRPAVPDHARPGARRASVRERRRHAHDQRGGAEGLPGDGVSLMPAAARGDSRRSRASASPSTSRGAASFNAVPTMTPGTGGRLIKQRRPTGC